MIKRFIIAALVLWGAVPVCRAEYPSDVMVLSKTAIAKLSDEQLIDAYESAVVEIDASRSFHATSGFSPKEYKDFKALLKYRLLLLVEIHSRNLEIPQF